MDTCKSRFCNSCGIKYQKTRSAAVMEKVFDCSHRHAVFTVPEPLRELFLQDRSLLNELFAAANDTLSFVIRKAGTKNDELIPCAVLLAEGGVRKSGSFKPLKYINYASLHYSFQKQLLDRLSKRIDTYEFKRLKRQMYKEYPDGFYVYCPESKHKNIKDTVDYVTRYVGSRINA